MDKIQVSRRFKLAPSGKKVVRAFCCKTVLIRAILEPFNLELLFNMMDINTAGLQTKALSSLLEGFPDGVGTEILMADSDEELVNAPIFKNNRGGEPLTPPLSLPDSFDEGEFDRNVGSSMRSGRTRNDTRNESDYRQVSRLQSLLIERNEKFRDLSISENLYNELRLRPESDLSLYELAQMKTYEFTITAKRETEKMRRKLQDTANELMSTQARADEATAQLSRQTKKMLLEADSAKMEASVLEERCARLTLRLKDETSLRQEGEEKSVMFDRQQKLLEQTQKE